MMMLWPHTHCAADIGFGISGGGRDAIKTVFVIFGLIGEIPRGCQIV
jgi:hypothetical protein